jgi:hypothetical protein
MNDSIHVHRFSPSSGFGYLLLGAFMLFIIIGTVFFSASNIFSDKNVLDYVGNVILIAVVLPLSLVLLARPFLTRMIVKPEGIEYHSTFFVLEAEWKNLVNIGYVQKTNAGRTLVVVPKAGKLIYRKWAKPFRNLFKEYPNKLQDVEILVSQFSRYNGHSFEEDILVNVAQNSELSEMLEPLKS